MTAHARTAVAVRHVGFENLGILGPILRERGFTVTYLDAGIDDIAVDALRSPDLLVVLGGPISANDTGLFPVLADEIAGIAARLGDDRPTLGVCLGAQLMARAAGETVMSSGAVEIGYAPVDLTEDGRMSVLAPLEGVPVLHWHGETFTLPAGAVNLASTPIATNQAFALGVTALGLQFHLEADPDQLERWLIGHSHELTANGIDIERLRADASEHGPRLLRAAEEVFSRWLDAVA